MVIVAVGLAIAVDSSGKLDVFSTPTITQSAGERGSAHETHPHRDRSVTTSRQTLVFPRPRRGLERVRGQGLTIAWSDFSVSTPGGARRRWLAAFLRNCVLLKLYLQLHKRSTGEVCALCTEPRATAKVRHGLQGEAHIYTCAVPSLSPEAGRWSPSLIIREEGSAVTARNTNSLRVTNAL